MYILRTSRGDYSSESRNTSNLRRCSRTTDLLVASRSLPKPALDDPEDGGAALALFRAARPSPRRRSAPVCADRRPVGERESWACPAQLAAAQPATRRDPSGPTEQSRLTRR